jgi:hypothetical protein
MALICSFERFSLSDLLLFSSCMNFSQREMKSRSDSLGLGLGTGIKTPLISTNGFSASGPIRLCGRYRTTTRSQE